MKAMPPLALVYYYYTYYTTTSIRDAAQRVPAKPCANPRAAGDARGKSDDAATFRACLLHLSTFVRGRLHNFAPSLPLHPLAIAKKN